MKWIFEGRVYSSLEELNGRTMSEDNKPEPFFTLDEMHDSWIRCRDEINNSLPNPFVSIYPDFKFMDYMQRRFDLKIARNQTDVENGHFLLRGMNKKVDVGEGAESESEL